MSGNAALAAARRRRSVPQVQSTNKNGMNNKTDNQYLNELNSIANEINGKTNLVPDKISISSIVINHEKKINILKKDLDEIKSDMNNIPLNSSDNKDVKLSLSQENLVPRIDKLENNLNTINDTVNTFENKLKLIETDLTSYKKDIENFKVIFLNINKIVNDLKNISDTNTEDINNMKSFLNEHNFVEKTEQTSLPTIEEETKTETTEKIEMIVDNK